MINFLNLKEYKKGLKPVTTSEYFSKPGEFHPEGLFSEVIFGPEETPERKKTFSYISLNSFVIHPTAYLLLLRLDKKIQKYISATEQFILNSSGELVIDPKGKSGIKEFKKIFPKIKFRGGTDVREKFIKKLKDAYKNDTLFINAVPVIQEMSHLPIIVDPSHATGKRSLVAAVSRASIAAGADGLIIEVHPNPEKASVDGAQSLFPEQFEELMKEIKKMAGIIGRKL